MFPNISKQSQDLFKNCLGLPRQLSQNPGLYCRLEVKLGENSNFFQFQTGRPGKFPGKRKSPSIYRRDQRRRKPPEKGMPTPGNHGVGFVALGTSGSSVNSPSSNHQSGSMSFEFCQTTSCPQYSFNTSRLTSFSSLG